MSRRSFLLLPLAGLTAGASTNRFKPNEDWYEDLNRFAKQYNDFVQKIQQNIFDVGSWLKTCKLFHKLEQ